MTVVLFVVVAVFAGILLSVNARRRVQREASASALRRARRVQRERIPMVSNNVKGVTASQTIQPLRPHVPGAATSRDEKAG